MTKGLKIQQVADRLGVSPQQAHQLVQDGEIPAFNIAKAGASRAYWRVEPSDLEEFITRRKAETRQRMGGAA